MAAGSGAGKADGRPGKVLAMSTVEQVLNLKFYKGEDLYSDGDVEDRLLALCESGRPLQAILMENEDWPILYHLSDVRENVLEWYGFDPQASLLEIGAGCGAVTGLFCRRVLIGAHRVQKFLAQNGNLLGSVHRQTHAPIIIGQNGYLNIVTNPNGLAGLAAQD